MVELEGLIFTIAIISFMAGYVIAYFTTIQSFHRIWLKAENQERGNEK